MAVSYCAAQHILKCKMETKIFVICYFFSFFLSALTTVDTFANCPGASINRDRAWLLAIWGAANSDPKSGDSLDVNYLDLYITVSCF